MANQVRWRITFKEINEEAKAHLAVIQSRIRETALRDIYVNPAAGVTYEVIDAGLFPESGHDAHGSRLWNSGENFISGESKWNVPQDLIMNLLHELSMFDSQLVTTVTFEIEYPPDEYGVFIFEGTKFVDGFRKHGTELPYWSGESQTGGFDTISNDSDEMIDKTLRAIRLKWNNQQDKQDLFAILCNRALPITVTQDTL